MNEQTRNCPNCGHSLLGLTSTEEIASCPNCGKFYERFRPAGFSRWPALWKMSLALCGPMLLVAFMQVGQFAATRGGHQAMVRVLQEMIYVCFPLAWFVWPIVAAFLLARHFAPAPERWMSAVGLTIAGLVGCTAINLASMLLRLFL